MPSYLFEASMFNSAGRPFGIGRYALHLANALHELRGELAADERLLATVRVGPNAVTEDLRLDRHADAITESQPSYDRRRKRELPATLRESGADLVHYVEGPQALFVPGAVKVVTCHDLIPLLFPHEYLPSTYALLRRRARDHLAYSDARRIIAISETTARELVERMGIARERISVVLQGVDHERFHPRAPDGESEALRRRLGLPARYSLYVGATDPRKRVDLLVACYRAVYRATGVPLVLVGAEFAAPKERARRALANAEPGSVVLLGEVAAEHLPPLYRHAELHVLPSVYEGFGLTVLEAMASGCPVLTTRGGALHEVAGEAARFVAPDGASELEQALVSLLEDETERARLRALGLEQARRFTWQRTARETLAVYRAAMGRGVRASSEDAPTARFAS